MRIGVVSDTHGHLGNAAAAVERLAAHDVSQVLHCGDIGSPQVVPLFSRWPTHFVFGNVDQNETDLRFAIREAQQTCHDRLGELELEGRSICLLHSDDAAAFRDAIESQRFDLVCYGHTHKQKLQQKGRTLVLNPGALYRANPKSLAIVDLATLDVRIEKL